MVTVPPTDRSLLGDELSGILNAVFKAGLPSIFVEMDRSFIVCIIQYFHLEN